MKISIFNQFSSNHSAGFSILGRFKTEKDATAAASELSQLNADIIASDRKKAAKSMEGRGRIDPRLHQSHWMKRLVKGWFGRINRKARSLPAVAAASTPESEFAERHGLAPFNLDFAGYVSISGHEREGHLWVARTGNVICLRDAGFDTWSDSEPSLEQYLRMKGAEIITGSMTDDGLEKEIEVDTTLVDKSSEDRLAALLVKIERHCKLITRNEDKLTFHASGPLDDIFEILSQIQGLGVEVIRIAEIAK